MSIIGITSFAQSLQYFRTTSFAYRYADRGQWSSWSDWEICQMNMTIDLANDMIYIYSERTQIYNVLYQEASPYDSSGQQIKFRVIDQDGDYGHIRLRIENNGNSQIYVDFADIAWVYNVRRIQ